MHIIGRTARVPCLRGPVSSTLGITTAAVPNPHTLLAAPMPPTKHLFCAAVSTVLLLSASAQAQEFKPYPRANITSAQWQAYFDEVREKHGASVQDLEEQKLLVYTDRATTTIYGFTKPGHPAHPAWVARKPEQRGDSIFIGQIGYFAGSEPPFAQLFKDYLALNEKMKDEIKRKQQEGTKQ